jgi:hypothetical protein
MKKNYIFLIIIILFFGFVLEVSAQKLKLGKICGNPNVRCVGSQDFQPNELTFEIPKNAVIYESKPFYAIILKSSKLKNDNDCETLITESERLDTQNLFPNNKVFALKCLDAGGIYYTNVSNGVTFLAVFAGNTLAEAQSFLKTVQATAKFGKVNLRKMQAGINGT